MALVAARLPCVSSPAEIQHTVRRLDEDVTVIVDSLARVEATQETHTAALTELRSDVTELRSDVTELRSDVTELRSNVTELRSDVTELRSGMNEVLALLRGDRAQE